MVIGMNFIEWNIRALKQLKKIPGDYRGSIVEAVDGLAQFPAGNADVKALKNHACEIIG
jgi:mRNA-degrading endonuclease RelE of RelBE toxin-antitoxin system